MLRPRAAFALALTAVLGACNFPGAATTPATSAPGTETSAPPELPVTLPPLPTLPEEAILILEPGPGSRLVGMVHVAGFSDPAFEQTLGIRILLDDGTLATQTSITIQAEWGSRGPFAADIPFTVSGERNGFIQVFAESARDGGITHLSSVGVVLAEAGPVHINPGSLHPEDIVITRPALGETLAGGVAHVEGIGVASFEQTLSVSVVDGEGTAIATLPVTVNAPDLGLPGTFSIDLAYMVAVEQPGRIVVRDISPAFGGDSHLSSVEVTLAP